MLNFTKEITDYMKIYKHMIGSQEFATGVERSIYIFRES